MAAAVVVVGSCNADLIAYVDRAPNPGETLLGNDFKVGSGGKGANQAVAAARLGAQVSMLGCVGEDVFGQMMRKALSDSGVDVRRLATHTGGVPSGVAPITVVQSTGQNAIVVVPGANHALRPRHVHDWLSPSAQLVVAQLETRLEPVRHAFRLARRRAAITLLNPAPMNIDAVKLLGPWTDILIPNEVEAAELLGTPLEASNPAAAESAAKELLQRGFAAVAVIITLGAYGAVVACRRDALESVLQSTTLDRTPASFEEKAPIVGDCAVIVDGSADALPAEGEELLQPSPEEEHAQLAQSALSSSNIQIAIVRAPKLAIPVCDTTGAGDCFLGAFVARLVSPSAAGSSADAQARLLQAVEYGCRAASFSVTRPGTQSSYPVPSDLEENSPLFIEQGIPGNTLH